MDVLTPDVRKTKSPMKHLDSENEKGWEQINQQAELTLEDVRSGDYLYE